jgi:hypothetical protein
MKDKKQFEIGDLVKINPDAFDPNDSYDVNFVANHEGLPGEITDIKHYKRYYKNEGVKVYTYFMIRFKHDNWIRDVELQDITLLPYINLTPETDAVFRDIIRDV